MYVGSDVLERLRMDVVETTKNCDTWIMFGFIVGFVFCSMVMRGGS